MSLAIVYSRANLGLSAPLVTIEVHLSKGLPGLSIVGLPEKAVKESKDRVRSALLNNDFEFPVKRIVINLAPADLPKEGGRFDLPIAIGILAASNQVPNTALAHTEFVGELALTGELKSIKGMLPFVLATKKSKRSIILPKDNTIEASLINDTHAFAASHLNDVCAHLHNQRLLPPITAKTITTNAPIYPDLSDVRGQRHAKRALEIAAAGGHSILFKGPPGTGKTMLSSRLPGILPDLTEQEAQETAAVYSISSQGFQSSLWKHRPFRAPHHTASSVALVGGGSPPKPGEISLAHNGVLFLDELPEYNRHVLESLREPIESGHVTISRASRQAEFPSRFQLIAAMNPCPCGYHGDANGRCRCTPDQISRYQNRLSGPLLDRIDMQVSVPLISPKLIFQENNAIKSETSMVVKERVCAARHKQQTRSGCANSQLSAKDISAHCLLHDSDRIFLENSAEKLQLSARGYSRVLKLARTIADLDDIENINASHLKEALGYRAIES